MADQEKKPLQDITGKEILSDEELENVAGGMRRSSATGCDMCAGNVNSKGTYVNTGE